MNDYHVPVLLEETLHYLDILPGEKYIDCTLGGGGHTEAILGKGGLVLGIDQDQEAIEYNQKDKGQWIKDKRLILKHDNFAHLKDIATEAGFERVAGIILDLGVSTHQLSTDYRGFSFGTDAILDMRMDPGNQKVTAADLVNVGNEAELAHIFWKYGEEKAARRIAKAIVGERVKGNVESTDQLVRIILSARRRGKSDRTHPATRVFQALRIAVNDELESLEKVLPQAVELLEPGGRLVIISFHSLEDRIIKRYFLDHQDLLRIVTDKPVTPAMEEIQRNPRARSGKMRVAEKNVGVKGE